MATGTVSNFTIYDEQFWGGVTEVLQQNAQIFNERSFGALRLATDMKLGNYDKETFLKEIANGGIQRRDNTSVASAADTPSEQAEHIGVKLNRRFQFGDTLDKWKKIGSDQGEMSFLLGQQYAVGILVEQANTAIRSLKAAISANAGVFVDATGFSTDKAVSHTNLAKAMYKFGDRADRIVAWVMHSASARDLLINSIENQTNNFQVAGLAVIQGSVATLGRPIIVVDSPALVTAGTPNDYTVLGLAENAAALEFSEDRTVVADTITGLQNIVIRLQGEYAYNVKLKGYSWNTGAGGVNPSDSALGTGSNWTKVAADNKSTSGVALLAEEATLSS